MGANSGEPLFRCDEDQRIVEWNDAAARLTGIARGDARGRRCWEVIAGTDDAGRPVCHPGCAVAKLIGHGWPVGCTNLNMHTRAGRRRVSISTIVVRGSETLILHPIHVVGQPAAASATGPQLTPRQLEILALLAAGTRVKEIARHLALSQTTVRNHVRALLLELGAHSQLEAVAKARALELVA